MAEEGKTIDEVLAAERGAERPEVAVDAPDEDMDIVRAEMGIAEGVDPLAALLDAPDEAPTQDVTIARLGAVFTVSAIADDKLYDRLVERCTFYTKGRRSGRVKELDGRRLARLTVAEFCENPVFTPRKDRDKFDALAEKYGTKEPEDLVRKALFIGEIDLLADTILSLSGFDDQMEIAGN